MKAFWCLESDRSLKLSGDVVEDALAAGDERHAVSATR
jgi:hypothetical protein